MIYMLGLQEETSFQINTFLKVQRNQTLLVQYNRSISQCLMQRPYSDRIILINLSVVNTIAQFLAKIRLEINHTAIAIFQIRPILKLDKDLPLIIRRVDTSHRILTYHSYSMIIDGITSIPHTRGH